MFLSAPSDTDEALAEAFQPDGIDGWSWAVAGGVLLAAILISRIVKWALIRSLRGRLDAALANLIGRVGAYAVVIVGLVYALEELGVRIGPILGALGIAGIALAFALRDILENFVAGVLLQLQRPFKYDDQVKIDEMEGTVVGIDTRLVTLLSPAGETLKIPSATVIKADINNYTAHGGRRTTVPVGVAYGTDLSAARSALSTAVRSAEGVRDEPSPEVLLEAFGDSSIDFVVRFWHEPSIASFWNVRDDVVASIDRALTDAGIEIPFPQRTLWSGADESVG